MSTRSSDWVDRVVKVSPHEQRTVATLYSGWMPCFMRVCSLRLQGDYVGFGPRQHRRNLPMPLALQNRPDRTLPPRAGRLWCGAASAHNANVPRVIPASTGGVRRRLSSRVTSPSLEDED